ncbi:hypothetical protein CMI42_04215 [Candidatus Pacearchaeota archaeon]|nr:hypothetical protein [Candidatus Pacearchaeota archaeon]
MLTSKSDDYQARYPSGVFYGIRDLSQITSVSYDRVRVWIKKSKMFSFDANGNVNNSKQTKKYIPRETLIDFFDGDEVLLKRLEDIPISGD